MPKTKAKTKKKNAAKRRGRQKSVYVRNFTGRISQNKDKTVSVIGRGHRGAGKKRAAKKGKR